MTKIFIKPNPKVSNNLLGYVKLQKRSTTKEKSGVETVMDEDVSDSFTRAPGTSFRICANPSMKLSGNLNTGMLHNVTNPYKDHTTFADARFKAALEGQAEAKLQHIVEFKYGKAFDYLTNQFFDVQAPHEPKDIPAMMKGDYTLELRDGVTILDTDTEFGEIMYYICRANELIANSFEELTSKTPFYIAKEEEEESIKQKKQASRDRCIAILVNMFDNNRKDLIEFCKALDLKKVTDNESVAYNELKAYINTNEEQAKTFLGLFNMYSEVATRNLFKARVLLYDARWQGIIHKEGATYVWYLPKGEDGSNREPLKFDRYTGENSIIEFLSHPRFAKEQLELIEQIKRATQYHK